MESLRSFRDVQHVRNTGSPKWGDPYGDGVLVIVGGVTPIQGDGNAVHRAMQGRRVSFLRNTYVIVMMQVDKYQETGGIFVRRFQASSQLESLMR